MTIKIKFFFFIKNILQKKRKEILKLGENICNTYRKGCQEYLKTYKSIRSTKMGKGYKVYSTEKETHMTMII